MILTSRHRKSQSLTTLSLRKAMLEEFTRNIEAGVAIARWNLLGLETACHLGMNMGD